MLYLRLCIVFCFVLYVSNLQSQSNRADSLYQLFLETDSIPKKLNYLFRSAQYEIVQTNYEQSKQKLDTLEQLAKIHKNPLYIHFANAGYARISASQGQYENAIAIYEKLINNYNSLIDPTFKEKIKINHIYYNLGLCYESIGEIDKQLQSYEKAIDAAKLEDDPLGRALGYTSIAYLQYTEYQDINACINFNRLSLKYALESNNYSIQNNSYINLINNFIETNQLDSAKNYIQLLDKNTKDDPILSNKTQFILIESQLFEKQNQLLKALKKSEAAYALAKEKQFNFRDQFYANIIESLGHLYQKLGQPEKAEQFYKEFIAYQEKNSSYNNFLAQTYEFLYLLYEEQDQADSAFVYIKKHTLLKDSLNTISNELKAKNLVIQAKLEDQKLKNDLLKEKEQSTAATSQFLKYILIGIGIALVLISLLSMRLFHTLRKNERLSEALQSSNENLQQKTTELHKSNNYLKTLAYSIAHDIQSPLKRVIYHLKEAQTSSTTRIPFTNTIADSIHPSINKAHESAQRLQSFSNNIMLLHHVEHNLQLMEEVDMNKVLRDVQDNLKVTTQSINAQISVASLPSIHGYQVRMVQLFQNLVENALKYRHPNRACQISIAYKQLDDMHQFLIQDNGRGIEYDMQQHLFTIFETGHPNQGKGIGLAVSWQIAQFYGGNLSLKSTSPQGTTFEVLLPV